MKRQSKSVGKLVVLENNAPIFAETEQIQNRIRERAYKISQIRGHAGREIDDWLSAESDVISVPPMDMGEKEEIFQVKMLAAGFDPADLSVMASPEQLLVKCDSHHNHDGETGILHVCDFKSATLFRSFSFPHTIDVQSIKLDLEDGMLRITATKAGAAPATRRRAPARKSAATKSKQHSA